jgi:hypothetical protein
MKIINNRLYLYANIISSNSFNGKLKICISYSLFALKHCKLNCISGMNHSNVILELEYHALWSAILNYTRWWMIKHFFRGCKEERIPLKLKSAKGFK